MDGNAPTAGALQANGHALTTRGSVYLIYGCWFSGGVARMQTPTGSATILPKKSARLL